MTAIFLRPIATDAAGNWLTDAAGADLHTAIDEATRSDADFIRSGDNPSADLCRVKLAIDGAGEIGTPSGGISTFNPNNTNVSVESADFDAVSMDNIDYANAREGTGNFDFVFDSTFTVGQYGENTPADENHIWECYESFLRFDTSAVAAASGSAYLSIVAIDNANNQTADTAFDIEARRFDWTGEVDATDFIAGSQVQNNTLAGTIDASTIALGVATTIAVDFSAINQSGATGFVLNSSLHRLGTPPDLVVDGVGVSEYLVFTSAGPFLSVDTTVNPVTIRYTVGKAGPDAATATINQVVRLVQNAVTIAEWTHNNVSSTLALHEQTLTDAEAGDVDWAAVNADTLPLFLEFVATRSA